MVFGDVTLLKKHVRQVCSANLEPRQWRLAHDPSLQPRYRMRQQHIPEEDQAGHVQRTRSKMKYVQLYVKEHGDTPLCNVNRAEKGTVTLEEDQDEVPTVGEDRDTEKESDHPEHPSHAAPMDHICRTRSAKSCGSRDDSLSWNLSRVKQVELQELRQERDAVESACVSDIKSHLSRGSRSVRERSALTQLAKRGEGSGKDLSCMMGTLMDDTEADLKSGSSRFHPC